MCGLYSFKQHTNKKYFLLNNLWLKSNHFFPSGDISKFPGVVIRIFAIFYTIIPLVISLGDCKNWRFSLFQFIIIFCRLSLRFWVFVLTILESTYKLLCTVNFTIIKYISKPNIMMFKKRQRTIIFDKQFLHDLKMS